MAKADIETEKLRQWQLELSEEIASINAKIKPLVERSRLLYEKLGAVNRLLSLSEGKKGATEEEPSQAKLMSLGSGGVEGSKRDFTPTSSYWLPILETLAEMGGSGQSDEVILGVGEKMQGILKAADFEVLPSGADIRWRNRVAWQRYNMVKQGILKPNSPRGVWELTEKGRAELLKRKTKSNSEVHKLEIKPA